MADRTHTDALAWSFRTFMRYFLVHVNPILHRAEYRGRAFTESEVVVLLALSFCGALRPTDLARGLDMPKGSLTPVFRRLRDLGLVRRCDIPHNERSYLLELTSEGEGMVRRLDEQRSAGFAALFGGMRPEEVEAATRAIDAMTAYLQRVEESRVRAIQTLAASSGLEPGER